MEHKNAKQKRSPNIQSVSRAISILRCFIENNELGLTEIAELTGLNKTTAAGIINTLKAEHFLEADDSNRSLRLGPELFRISTNTRRDLREIARPYMKQLQRDSGETVSLSVRNGSNILFLEQQLSDYSLKFSTFPGGQYPFYCTGMGKAIFAYLPEDVVREAFYTAEFKVHTENTIHSYDELLDRLSKIREDGYSTDNCEWEDHLRAVAAPIFNARHYPIAAISISGPSHRLTQEMVPNLAVLVKKTADNISSAALHMR